jgi:hypothetical protein
MGDWINDALRKPATSAVSALLAVAAIGGHVPNILAGDDSERVREVVRTVIQEEYAARVKGLEPIGQFIHRIDKLHIDCLNDMRDKGADFVAAETVCSLRSLEEIAIRGIQ